MKIFFDSHKPCYIYSSNVLTSMITPLLSFQEIYLVRDFYKLQLTNIKAREKDFDKLSSTPAHFFQIVKILDGAKHRLSKIWTEN